MSSYHKPRMLLLVCLGRSRAVAGQEKAPTSFGETGFLSRSSEAVASRWASAKMAAANAGHKPVIILDGLNIARARSFCEPNANPTTGSALALKMALDHFSATSDVEVHVILPAWSLDGGRGGRSISRLNDGLCAPTDCYT